MHEGQMRVIGKQGLEGVLRDPVPRTDSNLRVRIELDDGRVIEVPGSALRGYSPNTYSLELTPDEVASLRQSAGPIVSAEEAVVPVMAEEVRVSRQEVKTGAVRVHRRVREHDEDVEIPLLREHLDVRRVLIDREVDGPQPVRTEGETTIIPIVEEIPVVSKRYVLKEEVHITRQVREELHRERVTLKRQESAIERVNEDGRPA